MRWGGALGVAIVVGIGLGACTSPGIVHHVKPGETLYRIGKAYGVSHRKLAALNDIADPDRIAVGQAIRVPGADRELPVTVITPRPAGDERAASVDLAPRDAQTLRLGAPAGVGAFAWPVDGARVESGFGPRDGTRHDGIDLSAPEGTPVRAARGGRVLYSDRLRGYGNVIIVEHGAGWATVYAHNRDNRVRAGEAVRRGDVIATLGSTGKTTGPNLHFEVREENIARDPLLFLPAAAGLRGAATRRIGDPDS